MNNMNNTNALRLLELCAGVGGIGLAAEMVGGYDLVGQVEIDPFCRAVLAKHWPAVKRMGDIHEVTGNEFGQIDIIAGGIPCQGNSLAGKRRGRADERNLWPDTARIIRRAQPRWVVVENVVGLLSVDVADPEQPGGIMGDILRDLAQMGYAAGWGVWGAADMGAPHRRERVFIVGYRAALAQPESGECHWRGPAWAGITGLADSCVVATTPVADPNQRQRDGRPQLPTERQQVSPNGNLWPDISGRGDDDPCDTLANTDSDRRGYGAHQPQSGTACHRPANACIAGTTKTTGTAGECDTCVGVGLADAHGAGCRERHAATVTGGSGYPAGRSVTDAGATTQSADGNTGVNLRENAVERRLGGATARFPGWLDGPRWPAGPTETQQDWEAPRVLPRSQHKPNRNARLKALGNAIVPQQIAPLLAAIATIEGGWSP